MMFQYLTAVDAESSRPRSLSVVVILFNYSLQSKPGVYIVHIFPKLRPQCFVQFIPLIQTVDQIQQKLIKHRKTSKSLLFPLILSPFSPLLPFCSVLADKYSECQYITKHYLILREIECYYWPRVDLVVLQEALKAHQRRPEARFW